MLSDFSIRVSNILSYVQEINKDVDYFGQTMPLSYIILSLEEVISVIEEFTIVLMEYYDQFNCHLIQKQSIVNLKPLVVKAENARYLLQKLLKLLKAEGKKKVKK